MNFIHMIASAICALLAGTGVGAGGLFIIFLTTFTQMPQSQTQAVNLAFFLAAVSAALPLQIKSCKIRPRLILLCALFGSVGTLLGTKIRLVMPEEVLRTLFGIMLVFAGARTLFRRKTKSGGKSVK